MDFVISEELDRFPLFTGISVEDATAMKSRFCNWRKTYNKQQEEGECEKEEDEYDSLITPEQVQIFEEVNFIVSKQEFTTMRDNLMTTKVLANAH